MKLVMLAILGWGTLAAWNDAVACSCIQLPTQSLEATIGEYDAVFVGRVARQHVRTVTVDEASGYAEDNLVSEFIIERAWKGIERSVAFVSTDGAVASCGYPFKVGQQYLVLAKGEQYDMYVHLCGHTQPLARVAKLVAELGEPEIAFDDAN